MYSTTYVGWCCMMSKHQRPPFPSPLFRPKWAYAAMTCLRSTMGTRRKAAKTFEEPSPSINSFFRRPNSPSSPSFRPSLGPFSQKFANYFLPCRPIICVATRAGPPFLLRVPLLQLRSRTTVVLRTQCIGPDFCSMEERCFVLPRLLVRSN